MVVKAALFVALLAGEAIALAGEAAEAGLAVGEVLLAVDEAPGGRIVAADDHDAAAKVVAEVVFHGGSPVVGEGVADADEGNALLVVHDVEAVVLSRAAGGDEAVVLEE